MSGSIEEKEEDENGWQETEGGLQKYIGKGESEGRGESGEGGGKSTGKLGEDRSAEGEVQIQVENRREMQGGQWGGLGIHREEKKEK